MSSFLLGAIFLPEPSATCSVLLPPYHHHSPATLSSMCIYLIFQNIHHFLGPLLPLFLDLLPCVGVLYLLVDYTTLEW